MDREELRRRLAQRPNAVRFDELRRYLELCGYTLDRSSGSHRVFWRAGHSVVIPYRRPHVLAVYVRRVLRETRQDGDDV
ncbi:MAG TPA: type II toxin-antitoxin system HicA family toxin [Dehalococcoidia bacterium]|nr:type II toxin-antitoxin system HicA family toxin [Dehalococcoidia bacterium]